MEFKELSDTAVIDSFFLTYVNKIFSIWSLSFEQQVIHPKGYKTEWKGKPHSTHILQKY